MGASYAQMKLSGGQKTTCSHSTCLDIQTANHLADEPTGALDSKTSVEVMNITERTA